MDLIENCPFCGSDDVELILGYNGVKYIQCLCCKSNGPEEYEKQDAIDNWNERC